MLVRGDQVADLLIHIGDHGPIDSEVVPPAGIVGRVGFLRPPLHIITRRFGRQLALGPRMKIERVWSIQGLETTRGEMRHMRSGKGNTQTKRSIGFAFLKIPDARGGSLAGTGHVLRKIVKTAGAPDLRLAGIRGLLQLALIPIVQRGIILITRFVDPIEILELRFLQQMILAEVGQRVAFLLQRPEKMDLAITFQQRVVLAHAMGMRVTSREEIAATRHADRTAGKKIVQVRARPGDGVHGRRMHRLVAIHSQRVVALLISHNEHQIRTLAARRRRG